MAQPSFASEQWVKASKAQSLVKRERRKGRIPTSLQCRNKDNSQKFLKPEVKITWKDNSADIQWSALMFGGVNNWEPIGGNKRWQRKSVKRLKIASSGATFTCSLWYNKHLKASNSNAHKVIGAYVNGGFVSRKLR